MVPIDVLVAFVQEDAPEGDCTTDAVVPETVCRAVIRAKATGVIAGIAEAAALFEHYGVQALFAAKDGAWVQEGETVLEMNGDARAILLVERTAL
ncbi:MAG: carboxylating.nicotinate-nucleotide diphosphorylase, partial [Methanomicrobiales archaeon]|nr:carboxylating.nicotinate-nucleotide diphosphorylase [Methanomicrobiales archaeon]